ncbi:hypothetical protein FB45DRAFT_1024180 [Roridomyces roridus]|uniref:Uncharacterized protein n=1 Tax=Roridomyces roridus TaxID=1738132 RepID=A0AAD7C7M5_9AGAR|nr:hypothetical protein FB45DRAFT_1024180 [Roridomyces roridus]
MSYAHEMYYEDDEVCPDYNVAISRSNTATTTSSGGSGSSGSTNSHWSPPRPLPPLRSYPSPTLSPASPSSCYTQSTLPLRLRTERYVYTYSMVAAGVPLNLLISVEPSHGKPTPGTYTFRLSLKVCDVERPIGEPVVLRLAVDPRTLDFTVFLFPGKNNVVPAGTLFSLRVWLRSNEVDHRVFGEDEVWVGKDLDLSAIEGAVLARLQSIEPDAQVYDTTVGGANVRFVIRWQHLGERRYKLGLEYEAGGVGATLMDDLQLTVSDPRKLLFVIYTTAVRSVPAGASHRLRLWLKTSAVASDADDTHAYFQRLWKSDSFKIGSRLDFEELGPKLVLGVSGGAPVTVVREPETTQVVVGYQRESKMRLGM